MTDADVPPVVGGPIPTDVHARRADILRIGNRAAAAVQASNRQRGIANWYSLRGRLVNDGPPPASADSRVPPDGT
jgi:hypothetical protein